LILFFRQKDVNFTTFEKKKLKQKHEIQNNILVIHGPNLNLLGLRNAEIYGTLTLDKINRSIRKKAQMLKLGIKIFQTNHEGKIIDFIHARRKRASGILINPGALTHYSYAIRDAIEAVQLPAVEVHLSDIHNREDFRKISVIEPVCIAQVSGKLVDSYLEGLDILREKIKE